MGGRVMAEYIEREALRDTLYDADAITMSGVKILNQFPGADVAPVRHGQWVGDSFCKWQCNKCHAPAPKYGYPVSEFVRSSYCPSCGAKMDGGDNDEVD